MKCSMGSIPLYTEELTGAFTTMSRRYLTAEWDDDVYHSFKQYVDNRTRDVGTIKDDVEAMTRIVNDLASYDCERELDKADELCSRAERFTG